MSSTASEPCAFCDIVAGRAPATIVASDPLTIAFLDQRQFHPGHVLVVPRAHIADVRDADEATGAALMASVGRIARGVAGTFPNEGLSVWHSIGAAADQEVPHLHFHVHPRRLHDGLLRVYPRAPAQPDRGTLDEWGARLRHVLTGVVLLALLWASPAAAQPAHRFDAAVQVVVASVPQFDGSDFGVGGRLAWHTNDVLSFEGELNVYPDEFPGSNARFSQGSFSRRRVEGLFGVTAGVRLGTLRPFAKVRAGFLDVEAPSEPVVCILIFPPPLSCTLAGGRTLPAFELGAGVEVGVTPRMFLRIEGGDRILKYPGPAFIETSGDFRDDAFFAHGFRFAAGGGVRF
jgi:histidine triad (HIT) family protein